MTTPLAIIVAMGRNRVIGNKGKLPWHLPRDMQWFRKNTWGKPVIMGRRTCESLPRPLKERRNIVVSRQAEFSPEGFEVVPNMEQAIRLAESSQPEEIMIIGGETLYRAMLPQCHRIYLTEVMDDPEGDTWFPQMNPSEWDVVSTAVCAADEANPHALCFRVLERRH
ncbi:MAG: dihydrofolate reductase [Gammaproteobacteria bacterium]|nr:MAG: dihydrofolate reductase [Gammaproteobacteria bacterium]